MALHLPLRQGGPHTLIHQSELFACAALKTVIASEPLLCGVVALCLSQGCCTDAVLLDSSACSCLDLSAAAGMQCSPCP